MSDLWDYRPGVWDYREATWTLDRDLERYDVEAVDGCVGMVDHAVSDDAGAYVVVGLHGASSDAQRLVPARAIAALDHEARKVRLALTRDALEVAPSYDRHRWTDHEREEHERYYGERLRA